MIEIRKFKRRVADCALREMLRKSAVHHDDDAAFLAALLERGRYRRILEIGTYRGMTAAYMSFFCERVITIDLRAGKIEREQRGYNRAKIWRALGIENIDLHLVESNEDKARVVAAQQFDFAFIDGDHDHPGPSIDFDLVKRCGAVLFHDYGAANGVTALVDALPRSEPGSELLISGIFAFWRAAPRII